MKLNESGQTSADLCEYVVRQITAFDTGQDLDPMMVRELSQGISAYLGEKPESHFNDGELARTIARSLYMVGEASLGQRFAAVGSGMLRDECWEAATGGRVWILDLSRISISDDEQLELSLFKSLDLLLDVAASVWEESEGDVRPAIRGLKALARRVAGPDATEVRMLELAKDIREHCESRLKMSRREKVAEMPPLMVLEADHA